MALLADTRGAQEHACRSRYMLLGSVWWGPGRRAPPQSQRLSLLPGLTLLLSAGYPESRHSGYRSSQSSSQSLPCLLGAHIHL